MKYIDNKDLINYQYNHKIQDEKKTVFEGKSLMNSSF
jgi:hypothetical protein